MPLGARDVGALALGDATQELVEVERLGISFAAHEAAEWLGQLCGEVVGLPAGDAFAERLERRLHGPLGVGRGEVGLALHEREELGGIHACAHRMRASRVSDGCAAAAAVC